jgi:hypothetical protein
MSNNTLFLGVIRTELRPAPQLGAVVLPTHKGRPGALPSGHVAAPPKRAMNFRRFMGPSRALEPVCLGDYMNSRRANHSSLLHCASDVLTCKSLACLRNV